MSEMIIIPLPFAEEVRPGDSLQEKIRRALLSANQKLRSGDILIVKHKIVSKVEGQLVALADIKPSAATSRWARRYRLDPRVTQLALRESKRILRQKKGVLITETSHGLRCANSGVDVSNVNGGSHALLLPKDPDRSATQLHRQLKRTLGFSVPVIITDTFGRPWREGLTEVAIGVAGMRALRDYRKHRDPHGYSLRVTMEAVADELACAAGLVCGKLERTPACIIRGFEYQRGRGSARELIRPAEKDLFR
jgi:coenzyme F420-0:L-glutamate ligase / coenzyme F420-1:gamma-L-glutamate ligase